MSLHLLLTVWLVIGFVLATVTLPGTLELLLLTVSGVLPPRKQISSARNLVGRIAFVVPAHNEQTTIGCCVKSLIECIGDSQQAAVFVVADNCTDRTAVVAQQAGASLLVRHDDLRRGKGYALDFAFRVLSDKGFDFFIIVDADSSVSPNLLQEFVRAFASGASAVQCRYQVKNPAASIRTRLMNLALMAFNVLRPRGRDRLGISAGILGNGFGLSKAALQAVPYHAVSVVEDLEYHLRLVAAGLRVRFLDSATVFGDMPVGGKGVSTQRDRWEGGRFRMIREHVPGLVASLLTGKLRLWEPLAELLLLPLGFHVVLLALACSTPWLPVRLYAGFALALVGLHVLAAIAAGGGTWRDFAALFSAPFYVAWKFGTIPRLFRGAQAGAAWMRTERHSFRGGVK